MNKILFFILAIYTFSFSSAPSFAYEKQSVTINMIKKIQPSYFCRMMKTTMDSLSNSNSYEHNIRFYNGVYYFFYEYGNEQYACTTTILDSLPVEITKRTYVIRTTDDKHVGSYPNAFYDSSYHRWNMFSAAYVNPQWYGVHSVSTSWKGPYTVLDTFDSNVADMNWIKYKNKMIGISNCPNSNFYSRVYKSDVLGKPYSVYPKPFFPSYQAFDSTMYSYYRIQGDDGLFWHNNRLYFTFFPKNSLAGGEGYLSEGIALTEIDTSTFKAKYPPYLIHLKTSSGSPSFIPDNTERILYRNVGILGILSPDNSYALRNHKDLFRLNLATGMDSAIGLPAHFSRAIIPSGGGEAWYSDSGYVKSAVSTNGLYGFMSQSRFWGVYINIKIKFWSIPAAANYRVLFAIADDDPYVGTPVIAVLQHGANLLWSIGSGTTSDFGEDNVVSSLTTGVEYDFKIKRIQDTVKLLKNDVVLSKKYFALADSFSKGSSSYFEWRLGTREGAQMASPYPYPSFQGKVSRFYANIDSVSLSPQLDYDTIVTSNFTIDTVVSSGGAIDSFSASGVPLGMWVDRITGKLSGTPLDTGHWTVITTGYNTDGNGLDTVLINSFWGSGSNLKKYRRFRFGNGFGF
jgi:hypothetical protein